MTTEKRDADTLIKVVVVGDGTVGKTCLLISYTKNSFPKKYLPTVFDNYLAKVQYKKQEVMMELWDTAGQEEFDRIRPLSYKDTDIFLLCFAVDNDRSIKNITSKWVPEVKHHCSSGKLLVVGTKADLRNSAEHQLKLQQKGESFVSAAEGQELAEKIGAVGYCECSALTQEGLHDVFNKVIESTLNVKDVKERKMCCLL
ncbi:Rho family GTPase [Entamoeba histolytica HM-1:IMSS-B]|uniref:Rho small GTPase RacM n=9 Tax=Entamoeba TaxID=5758 RepID=RACM_ENTH1|nr:GTPase_rho, putative [Entamoeba dispar SAW760]XP_008855682.1 Rho family GTPase [Entamoeba nuttalli P19]XP_649502.1 Rho family GTPase [Entamoeba histolytica HM-1:IMSS]EMD49693.1 Rho GTPase, putative [Entamoeba histolytica KU27]EMH77491.1 Rho family GTPase [Entamoeba histolytica HM-1:IMSS-B]EMS17198.1 Rho GTPase, putative [Entamoeba histolytica HM-3:IMSS]ENY60048.1 RhoGTPase, putative [Entamoeba histolytica HM-1:IMSS-A]GAT98468.1 Rho family GTPase [Entamoeba histolytica]|eukprot:EDR26658.1 GTPase_rho, putative [Entamoeba dispar SAW760]